MKLRNLIGEAGLLVAGMMIGSGLTMLAERPAPHPAPVVVPVPAPVTAPPSVMPVIPPPSVVDAGPGVAIGRALAPRLLESLAQGFDAAAGSLSGGSDVEDANDLLKETFATERARAFAEVAGPTMARVVPEGSEPTRANREAFVQMHKDIARGLRSVK